MNLSNSELDQLFENVRKEKPVATFEETQRAFVAATIASAGGVLATKSLLKLFTFKQWIIMISVLSTVTVGTLLVTLSSTPVSRKEGKLTSTEPTQKEVGKTEKTVENPKTKIKKSFIALLDAPSPDKKVITRVGKEPIKVVAYLMDDGSYSFHYEITPETTEADLKKLQKEAKEAGFELKYEPSFNDGKLQRLNLHIVQKKENGQQQDIHISDINLEESPAYSIAWNVDEKGDATTIACGEDYRSEEIDELLAELELEELTADLAEMERDLSSGVLVMQESMDENLAAAEEELARVQELLETEEMREALLEIEELNDEALVRAKEEIERVQEEIERQSEEMHRQSAQFHADCEAHQKKCHEGHKVVLAELKKDGLIEDVSDRVKMKLSKGKLTVNGDEMPKKLRDKYNGLIKEYFDFDITSKDVKWTWVHDDSEKMKK